MAKFMQCTSLMQTSSCLPMRIQLPFSYRSRWCHSHCDVSKEICTAGSVQNTGLLRLSVAMVSSCRQGCQGWVAWSPRIWSGPFHVVSVAMETCGKNVAMATLSIWATLWERLSCEKFYFDVFFLYEYFFSVNYKAVSDKMSLRILYSFQCFFFEKHYRICFSL